MVDGMDQGAQQRALTQIAKRLHELFDGHIDLADVSKKSVDEQENYFLTRSYLALFFVDELGFSPAEAASYITDGFDDDGVDAICIDKPNARIYLAQSKWRKNTQKGIELQEFTRFRDGVKRIIELKWDKSNVALHRFRKELEQQLSDINTDVVMVFAHTSSQEMSEIIKGVTDNFLREENTYTSEFISLREFRLQEAAQAARSHTRPENISFDIMLSNWGMPTAPYKAVYGSVQGYRCCGLA